MIMTTIASSESLPFLTFCHFLFNHQINTRYHNYTIKIAHTNVMMYSCDEFGCYSTWDNWGRWVALAVIIVAILLLAFLFS